MKTSLKLGKDTWNVIWQMTNHAIDRCFERNIEETTIRKALDRVMPFIIRNLVKGDDRRLIIRDEKNQCSLVFDNFRIYNRKKQAWMKLVTVIDSTAVYSGQHERTRLVHARY